MTGVIEYDPLYDITVSNQFPQGLQMVSVPMSPFDDDPTAIFGPSLARWGSLEDGTPGYIYSGPGLERVTPYRGYWWKPDSPQQVTVNGRALRSQQGLSISLKAGLESGWLSLPAAGSLGQSEICSRSGALTFLGGGCHGGLGIPEPVDLSGWGIRTSQYITALVRLLDLGPAGSPGGDPAGGCDGRY